MCVCVCVCVCVFARVYVYVYINGCVSFYWLFKGGGNGPGFETSTYCNPCKVLIILLLMPSWSSPQV